MNFENKTIGSLLMGFSILLLILLTLAKINTDAEGALLCKTFADNSLDMNLCPAHKSSISWILVSSFGIGFLMLGLGGYLIFVPRLPLDIKKQSKPVDTAALDEEEKQVYESIRKNSGSVFQSDLIKETGFTKVKVTRVLDRLEMKDVLERRRRGMTNIIVLK